MASINKVSDICDIDIIIVEYFTTKESEYSGIFSKSERKTSPYILVNCNAPPKNIEKMKNIDAMLIRELEDLFMQIWDIWE